MPPVRTLTPTLARRLFISRQRLAGPPPDPGPAGMLEVIRDINCLQLDPISAVAPSHQLVLWSRLGNYDLADLDRLLWEERKLFEYWAHAASIVLTEDYHLHHLLMRNHPSGDGAWTQRITDWMEANPEAEPKVLEQLRQNGPMQPRHFEQDGYVEWYSGGWTSGQTINRMLDVLWTQGKIMVAGRKGRARLWDLAERCLPDWTPGDGCSEHDVVYETAQKSLKALGVGRINDIKNHFTRNRYPDLETILVELEADGKIVEVEIVDGGEAWSGPWYVHAEVLPQLDRLAQGDWEPRTTLLSPFDNLICNRDRTEALFNFFFRIEIYVPKKKRQYGYYVLPILHGDRLIGRLDPKLDRKTGLLHLNAIYAEDGAPQGAAVTGEIRAAIEDLARFVEAKDIVYPKDIPAGWGTLG